MISSKTGVRGFIEESTISCIHLKRIIMSATLDKINWKHQNQNVVKGHTISHPLGWVTGCLLWFLAATKQLYEWYFLSVCPSVCPSVRLSVCPSVTPFWPCSHHRIIMKFSGVITLGQGKVHAKGQGQRSRSQRSRPNFLFPDCNSSLNSHMMMKWYI